MGAETQTQVSLTTDAIYRTHMRAVYGFIYVKVGNREAAEDLTSEVFLRAVNHLDPAREERSILAWLYRVATNLVNDYWRSRMGAQVITLEEARLRIAAPPPPDLWRQEETTRRAQAVLERLPENYRTVLQCRLLEGMTVAETSRRMGTTDANVKVLQHRALKHAAKLRLDGFAGE
ncbi:MAG TPA: sigma-70 family RNA polymerase sigma factor [Chloroflexota bacterium]|nr:sigma-70 family RNA polymerase sigma factor [Chloroflexota bacterium]